MLNELLKPLPKQWCNLNVHSLNADIIDLGASNSFTPTLQFGGASVGITYVAVTGRTGRYKKIGNVVFFSFEIRLSSKGSSVGAATIAGLPESAVASLPLNSYSTHYNSISSTMAGYTQIGSSSVKLLQSQSLADITNSDFANDSVIAVTGFYFTA
jgi:hypothetical protein